jgi:hypothetical protein
MRKAPHLSRMRDQAHTSDAACHEERLAQPIICDKLPLSGWACCSPVAMPAKKTEKKSIVRITLTKPAARDEGPRLLPLNGQHNDTSLGKGEYYVQLAETLLHPKRKN